MIIVDFHQTMIANIMRMMYSDSTELSEELLRHNILSSLLRYRRKFKNEYGELLISCDPSTASWRKDIFPYYKAKRKQQQKESFVDWDFIHKFMTEIKAEIKAELPFITVEVPKAESDDIIAVLNEYILSEYLSNKNVIISRDKDFIQLLMDRTKQYNPIKNEFIENWCGATHTRGLITHILEGDVADGIPNILSDSDTFITEGKRQNPLTKKKIETYLNEYPDIIVNENFQRNQRLIDFNFIPDNIRENIIDEYENQKELKKNYNSNKLINYFMEKGLNNMIDNIQDFFI